MYGENVESIVSNEDLDTAYANANFGGMSKRDVVKLAVLKCASGYYQGYTSKRIIVDLGLVTEKYRLTKKGKHYLWIAFNGGVNF